MLKKTKKIQKNTYNTSAYDRVCHCMTLPGYQQNSHHITAQHSRSQLVKTGSLPDTRHQTMRHPLLYGVCSVGLFAFTVYWRTLFTHGGFSRFVPVYNICWVHQLLYSEACVQYLGCDYLAGWGEERDLVLPAAAAMGSTLVIQCSGWQTPAQPMLTHCHRFNFFMGFQFAHSIYRGWKSSAGAKRDPM